jgi:misacylated tRNA(Ala) deacylase
MPLGGGQAGDHGVLRLADGTELAVIDARKSRRDGRDPGRHAARARSGERLASSGCGIGTHVTAEIDWARRHRHMRFHTATHLLCAVVRELVDGCSITADYARLDFAMTAPLDKETVQQGLDRLIARALPVGCEWITDEELPPVRSWSSR